ncbi:MAG TPA: S41 family peptidase [Rhizomicrobium sp.]|nr:S41 family peptidase [Rhizomicrobium sp.]
MGVAISRILLALVGAAASFGLTVAVSHFAYGSPIPGFNTPVSELHRFGVAFEKVRDNYPEKPSDRTLVENALDGMLATLDAHSSYFDPDTFSAMETKAAGAYGGVGLVISVPEGAPKIMQVVPSTPASRAGLKAGDILVSVDGSPLHGLKLEEVSQRLRGVIGTSLNLAVSRGDAKPFTVKLTREAIEVERLTWHREGDIGYIKIVAFSDRTNPDLRAAVADLKKQIGPKLQGYVIDLRDNGGGVLQAAIDVSDDFLSAGEIVSVRGRTSSQVERYDAHDGDVADGKPIAVLVNGGTASASEIVGGALQDHARATIIGTLTFGKGSVQTVIPLDNGAGGALHMTTARYYTPSGRSIQVTGIVPDIVVAGGPDSPDYQREVQLPHHLNAEGPPAKPLGPTIQPPAGSTGDFQLQEALAFLHKQLAVSTAVPDHA